MTRLLLFLPMILAFGVLRDTVSLKVRYVHPGFLASTYVLSDSATCNKDGYKRPMVIPFWFASTNASADFTFGDEKGAMQLGIDTMIQCVAPQLPNPKDMDRV